MTILDISNAIVEYECRTGLKPTRIYISKNLVKEIVEKFDLIPIVVFESTTSNIDWDFELCGLKGLFVRDSLQNYIHVA